MSSFLAFLLGLLENRWVRISFSNVLLILAGLFTNLLSTDITNAPNASWHSHLQNRYTLLLVLVLIANTWMQAYLEPAVGELRTKSDFRAALRRGVSRDVIDAMRERIKGGQNQFFSDDEIKAILGLDDNG